MGFISWLLTGLVVGWISSIITVRNTKMGVSKSIVFGVVGSIVGGYAMNLLSGNGLAVFNIWSLFISIATAALLLWFVNAIQQYNQVSEH